MPDDRPVLDQVNLVVRDMDATVALLPPTRGGDPRHRAAVGAAPPVGPRDGRHRPRHRQHRVRGAVGRGWPAGASGAVLGFRVDRHVRPSTRSTRTSPADGAVGQQPPYDAFWGARYAVVADPDGNAVGIMSAIDPTRRTTAPDAD